MDVQDKGRLKAQAWPDVEVLSQGWAILATEPDAVASPDDLPPDGGWIRGAMLGPVADMLAQAGQWSLDGAPRRFDAQDWWYRLRFDAPHLAAQPDRQAGVPLLHLDGLATLAEVWLNGSALLSSANMFQAHAVPLGTLLRTQGNELTMVFRSLDASLARRRPRPRWRAPMIEHQQLRWIRTTVLARTPGWSPPAAVVGPWRAVWLSGAPRVTLDELRLHAQVLPDAETGARSTPTGRLALRARILAANGLPVVSAVLRLTRDEVVHTHALALDSEPGSGIWQGQLDVPDIALWWPHTHGEPAIYEASLSVSVAGGAAPVELALGGVGFRTVERIRREPLREAGELAQDDGDEGFGLRVNGVEVFCRGACWTPLDAVRLDGDAPGYRDAIAQLRQAGMNMVRVGGTMHYEADAFYEACDRLGVMVWQELMFANMDYPEDPAFVDGAVEEVHQQCGRWQARPAVVVVCGNSEVAQQAAMFGATRDRWSPALFRETLPRVIKAALPGVVYWPSSAHGGAFPHQGDAGTTSYYGVGAYQRGLDDARRSGLRFATECLAFSNIPEPAGLEAIPGGLGLRVHHAGWKARAPRDLGAGWDFEDVRDHYVAALFKVDPSRLRYSDHDRYLMLGRVAIGEVMAACFTEWRRAGSTCHGALIWFLRDLWAGAGWGIVDSEGRPKAPYYHLRRVLQPHFLGLTDEGGNGLYVHACNETAQACHATIEVSAWRHGQTRVAQGSKVVELPPRSARSWPLMAWFDWFADWSWSYRFGPPSAQVVCAVLLGGDGQELARAWAFPTGWDLPLERDAGLSARGRLIEPGLAEITVQAGGRFAQAVHLELDGLVPDDNYFHLLPGEQRTVRARALPGARARTGGAVLAGGVLSGSVQALNADASATIELPGQERSA